MDLTDVKKALDTVRSARETHAKWAKYFKQLESCGCEDCQIKLMLHADGVGSSEYQDDMVRQYDNAMLALDEFYEIIRDGLYYHPD